MSDPAPRPDRQALGAALFCYVFWGLVPLLFQAIGHAGGSPWEIIAWRTALAVPVAAALVWLTGQQAALSRLDRRTLGWLCLSALARGRSTGSVYVWAVNTGRTLQTSLGYYLEPADERRPPACWCSASGSTARAGSPSGLASAGVALQAVALGGLPWVSLVLALAFAALWRHPQAHRRRRAHRAPGRMPWFWACRADLRGLARAHRPGPFRPWRLDHPAVRAGGSGHGVPAGRLLPGRRGGCR